MKSLSLLISLILLSFVTVVGQVNLNQGLVAYYPFNGNANDQSGNNNNPVFNNASLVADKYGNPNGAYYFNGAGSYMRIPNSASLNPQRISISAIVKPMGFYRGPCHGNVILHKSNSGAASALPSTYRLMFDDHIYTQGQNCANQTIDSIHENFFADYGGNAAVTNTYNPFVELNTWYCLTYTFDGTTAKFYVNGLLVASKNTSLTYQPNNDDLYIGRLADNLFPYWFNGVIDELRIYNRALSAEEVNAFCSDCNSVTIEGRMGSIKVSGIAGAPIAGVQVFNSSWTSVFNQTYTTPQDSVVISNLPAGQYFVNVRFYSTNWVPICEKSTNAIVAGNVVPTISVNSVTVNENAGNAILQVCLSSPSTQTVTVQFNTTNGSAISGSDYTATASMATIPAGQTCTNISIPILNDASAESTENFTVTLSNPSNATIGNGTGTVTINDDDQPQFNCNNIEIYSGNNSITIQGLDAPVVTVQVFNSSWATVFNQTYTDQPDSVDIPISPATYLVKVSYYTSNWTFICEKSQNVTVINQCPPGATCISNVCPAQSVNLNTAYSIPNLPAGTVVSWHTGTPATDGNKLTPAQAQNVTTSGTYYAAINITGANCYSATIPVNVTIRQCSSSAPVNIVQLKNETTPATRNIMVFPNPFTRSVKVVIDSEKKEKASIILTDVLGRQLKSLPVQLVPGTNTFSMDGLDQFPSGNYFLTIQSSAERKTMKLMRQQ